MRIAFITDQHFDVSRRFEETVRVHQWIAKDIAKRGADLILLGGDLFERKSVPADRNAAGEWLRRLADIAEVVGVYGNHEAPNDLELFNYLETSNRITIYDRPTIHLSANGIAVACMPWPRKAHLLAQVDPSVDHERVNQIAVDNLQTIFIKFGLDLDQVSGPKVFLGHCMMLGSKVATGQPLVPGADFEITQSHFFAVRAQAYFLGHIHLSDGNEWYINGSPCFYGGSSTPKTWGETERKYYHLAEVEADGKPAKIIKVPTPATPMLLLESEWTINGVVLKEYEGSVRGAEIRYRYTVPSEHRRTAKVDAQNLKEHLLERGALDVKIEEVVIPTTRARTPEITQAQSLGDKLKVLWNARGDVPDPDRQERLLAKLNQIEQESTE